MMFELVVVEATSKKKSQLADTEHDQQKPGEVAKHEPDSKSSRADAGMKTNFSDLLHSKTKK